MVAVTNTASALGVPLLVRLAGLLDVDELAGQEWRRRAACRGQDPEFWFPPRGASHDEQKRLCRGCEVRLECLEFGLAQGGGLGDGGIWGGSSGKDRRLARRRGWDAARLIAELERS